MFLNMMQSLPNSPAHYHQHTSTVSLKIHIRYAFSKYYRLLQLHSANRTPSIWGELGVLLDVFTGHHLDIELWAHLTPKILSVLRRRKSYPSFLSSFSFFFTLFSPCLSIPQNLSLSFWQSEISVAIHLKNQNSRFWN